MNSDRFLSEKTRVALPLSLWLSLAGIIITGAGAWFVTRIEAAEAAELSRQNTLELREHDRRIQRLEDDKAFTREMLERLDKKLDSVLERK
jgi:hypothetical protein